MTPLYFDPAVGFSSTVAFRVFVLRAIKLYASRSSSRVASLATGIWATTLWPVTTLPLPQPQEIAASIANPMHVFTRRFNQFRRHHTHNAIWQPVGDRPTTTGA